MEKLDLNDIQPQLIDGHYTDQTVLASTSVKKWRILLEQSFTAHMPLLMATSTFALETRLNLALVVLPTPSQ